MHERAIPSVSPLVRDRVSRRARAALVAKLAAPSPSPSVPSPRRLVAALAMACVAGALVGAAAYEIRSHLNRDAAPALDARPLAGR